MKPEDLTNPDKYPNQRCGVFGEYAQPVKNLDQSVAFWQKLGFQVISSFTSPYNWAIMSDGLNVIGLHQNKHFTSPTITYFAADMRSKIEHLKAAGLAADAIKDQANITLTTPEQQHINLFKLGM
jgi:predicted lactoylglutathione lyase